MRCTSAWQIDRRPPRPFERKTGRRAKEPYHTHWKKKEDLSLFQWRKEISLFATNTRQSTRQTRALAYIKYSDHHARRRKDENKRPPPHLFLSRLPLRRFLQNLLRLFKKADISHSPFSSFFFSLQPLSLKTKSSLLPPTVVLTSMKLLKKEVSRERWKNEKRRHG